jgi:polyribonucleotide nucleotidyltransferase
MKFNLELGGKNLEIEVNSLAEQANGSVLARYGDTLVLTTCVMSPEDKSDMGFFPLTVEYQERYYAAGKIKGARYIRREGRPSDEAVINSRLIDRAIRPLFPKNLKREIQVISTVLSWDGENNPDIIGLISASTALMISDIPWNGPLGALRVVRKDNQFIINGTYGQSEETDLNIIFSGVERNSDVWINMIEAEFNEVKEELILGAYDFSKDDIKRIIDFQKEIQKKVGKEKAILSEEIRDEEFEKEMQKLFSAKIEKALFSGDKMERNMEIEGVRRELMEFAGEKKLRAASFFDEEQDRLVHEGVIKNNKRVDGRKLDQLRKISCEVGLLPRTHGSGLFCRGLTKSLSILTLGAPGDQQLIESMEFSGKKRFLHHYNFPPYSSGEVKPLRGPGRREIGHGMLAEKALLPLLPEPDNFPYTMRIVSEILSSNGSSSQASISSSSLALMDAGVPIKRPAAGIAIGLIRGEDAKDWKVLTDIQGPEDHHGDMDFKVAGTTEGITAIQMDIKIDGISREIMEEALKRGKKARLEILEEMAKIISGSRPELSPYAPRILTIQINPDKIREVIGPGGKVINEIIEKTGAQIDIEDSGLIFITAEKVEAANKALAWIENITREVKAGEVFEGKVKRILEFGAFVEVLPGQEGLIHISKLSNKRVNKVEDVVNVGDTVSVKVLEIDSQGRINLILIKNSK